MTCFYTTETDNIKTALRNGIRAGTDGLVHLSTDSAKAGSERGFHFAGPVAAVVFRVNVNNEDVQPYEDHIVYRGDIPTAAVGPVVRMLGSIEAMTAQRRRSATG